LSFILSVLIAISFSAIAGADNWLTCDNDRSSTTIDYPNIFKAQRPPMRMAKSFRPGTGFQTS
jgi:hypothetical protein